MILMFIKFKDGSVENYKIKNFTMVGSAIRIETDNDVLFLDYSSIEDIQITNS